MAHCIGSADAALTIYRLVSKGTIEERVQQLADKKKGSDSIFRSSHRSAKHLYMNLLQSVNPA